MVLINAPNYSRPARTSPAFTTPGTFAFGTRPDALSSTLIGFCSLADRPSPSPSRDIVPFASPKTHGDRPVWIQALLVATAFLLLATAVHLLVTRLVKREIQPALVMRSASIRKLPLEVLLLIGTFQDPVDRLSLAVCFPKTFGRDEFDAAPLEYRKSLRWRVRLLYLAEKERSWSIFPRTELVCSGCWRLHPARLFSPNQLRAAPEARVCIGREGRVRVCEHKLLTRLEIKDSIHVLGNHVRLCDSLDHSPRYVQRPAPTLTHRCSESGHEGACAMSQIKTTTTLMVLDRSEDLMIPQLQQIFESSSYQICPHLRLSDRLCGALLFHPQLQSFLLMEGTRARGRLNAACPHPNCRARFTISVETSRANVATFTNGSFFVLSPLPHGTVGVVLHVTKFIPSVEDATHPGWLGQLGDTRSTNCGGGVGSKCKICNDALYEIE
ncbi:hypothetical protein IWX90DRAFT_18329 [Phyllosticta citrichinensis]|uniref:Uncharacterized protein n=1 Tax=Phyllosticta citrichinensis TaxID=1130410 RepID=A0ABR1Y672_9PEZI